VHAGYQITGQSTAHRQMSVPCESTVDICSHRTLVSVCLLHLSLSTSILSAAKQMVEEMWNPLESSQIDYTCGASHRNSIASIVCLHAYLNLTRKSCDRFVGKLEHVRLLKHHR
jgi:hypothetical protein